MRTCSSSTQRAATSRAGSSTWSSIAIWAASWRRSSDDGAATRSTTCGTPSRGSSRPPSSVRKVATRGSPMADETLARMFWNRVAEGRERPAQMIKEGGHWQTLPWSRVGEIVRELALGFLAFDRRPGERVALLSRSRAEWVQADFAILSTGCLTVPIYPSYTPRQIAHIVTDSEARMLIV